jgi:hypothetical protein
MQRTNAALSSHSFSGQQTCITYWKIKFCIVLLHPGGGGVARTGLRNYGKKGLREYIWKGFPMESRHLPAVRDLTHDGIWSTYAIPPSLLFPTKNWRSAGNAPQLKLYHHQQNSPGWVIFLQLAKWASLLGQSSSLRPHWFYILSETACPPPTKATQAALRVGTPVSLYLVYVYTSGSGKAGKALGKSWPSFSSSAQLGERKSCWWIHPRLVTSTIFTE